MSEPFVKNTADEDQVKAANKKEKNVRNNELNEIRTVLDSPVGRKFLWRALKRCGVYQSSYHPSGSQVYFNEGRREVGLWLLAEITEANPDAYLVMIKEAKGREANGE